MERYFVTEPVEGGYEYYDVCDRTSSIRPNFALVTISRHMPHAKELAEAVCETLNDGTE